MDPDDINPDGEKILLILLAHQSIARTRLNITSTILANKTSQIHDDRLQEKELRAKNADAPPATIKRLLTKNNTPLNLTNPNKYLTNTWAKS